ncbi:MAG: D-glycero-beta-D-manno-heptose 1-phosphate adenylyltransferase, partial [Pseudomonadota bacterium]
ILRYASRLAVPGGAANVARNVAELGGEITLIGLIGDDGDGIQLAEMLTGAIDFCPIIDPARPTGCKTRFTAQGQQLLRFDLEENFQISDSQADQLLATVRAAIDGAGGLILSDYGKGVITERLAQAVIAEGQAAGCPVIVDPKGDAFGTYAGADYVTPNRLELGQATGIQVHDDATALAACQMLCQSTGIKAVLATRSEQGMSLFQDHNITHYRANVHSVYDVAGAGDTVVATFALALASGFQARDAARLANDAGQIVVTKRGTATVSPGELFAAPGTDDSQMLEYSGGATAITTDLEQARRQVEAWRKGGKKLVLTNGCFDLLHPGHLELLDNARKLGDRLILAINSDRSVRMLKGADRPICSQDVRAQMLAGLRAVDYVLIFDAPTPLAVIKSLCPDILVKGGDYRRDQIVGGDFVEQCGGQVVVVEPIPGFSTSALIARIRGS